MIEATKVSIFHKFFPAPRYLSLDPVGLDISNNYVRLMKLESSKFGLTPKLYDQIALKNTCNILESEKDLQICDELKEAVAKLKRKYGFKFANISIPEDKTYIFTVFLPKETKTNLREAISFKIEENIPLSLNEVVFDYKVLPNHKGSNLKIVVSALPKSVIDSYTKLFNSIGITALSFDSESQALARSVIYKNDMNSYILINFAPNKIGIAIVDDETVQYTTSIPVASSQVMQKYDSKEAQILKEQINKLLIYWFTNENDPEAKEKIQTAYITGEYTDSKGLVEFLEKHLGINVIKGNVWQNCFSLEKFVPKMEVRHAQNFGIAVGLALIRN